MDQQNVIFFEKADKSYIMVDLYPNDRFLGYKDSDNYYDTDADNESALDDGDEFIGVDVHKNASFVEGNYRNKLVIVLHSVIDNYLKTSLIQV